MSGIPHPAPVHCALCDYGFAPDEVPVTVSGQPCHEACRDAEAVRCWSCDAAYAIDGYEAEDGWVEHQGRPYCAACTDERLAEEASDAAADALRLAATEAMEAADAARGLE